jgi:membrane fusion protein, multidrug efflux system
MKTKIFFLIPLFILASCSPDKQAQLKKLREKQATLTEQIKALELEIVKSDTASIQDVNAHPVNFQELTPVAFNHFIEVQGRLDGDENVGVSPQAPGKIVSLYVSVGQSVTKGQVLAKIDDAVLQQSLKQLLTNLQLVTDIYNKQKNLWEQNVGSEVQYLTAKTNKESMEQQVGVIKDQIALMQLVSPINGTIEDITFKVGQYVAPGIPVMRLVNFSKTKVVADLAEAYAAKIKTNDRVNIYFPDLDVECKAVVNFSSRYINPTTRSFSVEAHLNAPVNGLKANMVAVMRINDYHNEKALAIPVNLIQKDGTGVYVYTVHAASAPVAKRTNIRVGQIYNGMAEILSGLNAGDKIITAGYQDVKDGETVRF